MQNEELKNLQAELDVLKWNDSQAKGVDACDSYDYCAKCDKNVEFPCATAKTAFTKKPKKSPAKKSTKAATEKPAVDKVVRVRKPRAKKAE